MVIWVVAVACCTRAFGAPLALVRAIEATRSQPAPARCETLAYLAGVKAQIVRCGFQW